MWLLLWLIWTTVLIAHEMPYMNDSMTWHDWYAYMNDIEEWNMIWSEWSDIMCMIEKEVVK